MNKNPSNDQSLPRKSGREMAGDNLLQFETWIAERDAAGDWQDYAHRGKLNRTEIALECGFALAVLRQNPAVKKTLVALEKRLQVEGVFASMKPEGPPSNSDASLNDESDAAVSRRIALSKNNAEKRVKALEEHNAALLAEVSSLREKLRRYKHIDEYLSETGRMVRP